MELNNLFFPTSLQTAVYPPPIADESDKNSKKCSRKNPWGNRSYADLITQAIETSPEKRLTLSQIYDWMIRNVPFFSDKGENNSSAGWKNSIRHNLSLHKKFHRIKNDGMGKSSWWTVNAAAGSGRIPRRKAPYRTRRGKALAVHQQLENLPNLFRNNRYGVQPKGLFQRNVCLGRTPWNTAKPVNESLQRIFQSTTSLNTVTSSTNHSKMLSSNISLVNAMCEKSRKANVHLPPLNHSQNIFATQTVSLTETNSNGSFNSFKRSYLHEEYVFQQTSSNDVPSKTLSTEYFRSPHHLSGSYITEVGREQENKVGEIIKNTVENNSFQLFTEKVSNTVPKQINNLSNNEIDSLLCVNVQHDISKFRSVLKELCSEINKYDTSNNEDCDSIINQLVYKQNSINSNKNSEEILNNFSETNGVDRVPLQLENLLGETIPPKVSSAGDITNPEFQKTVPNNFQLSPKESPSYLYNNGVKSENGTDILRFLEITTDSPGSECIEEIIEMLNSPKPEHTSSTEVIEEVKDCKFADNQSIFKQSLQLLKGRSGNIQCLNDSRVEALYDCNILLGPFPSEVTNTSPNITKVNISNCTVNELEQNVNTADLMQFSNETAQLNSATDFSICCTIARIDEIIEKEPISLKEIDVACLLNKCKELPESSLSVDPVTDTGYNTSEFPKIIEIESPILCLNDDFYDASKTNNAIQNSNGDFLSDSSDLIEKEIKGQHAMVEQNDMDLSTHLKVLQTLEEMQKSDQQITENMFEDTDFDNRASVVMMSGLNKKDLMEEKEMTDNYLMRHPMELTSNSNILADDLDMLIDVDYPFLLAETSSDFQNVDNSLPAKQFEKINNLSCSVKEAFDIEDSILYYLKSDVILDEFLNYVSSDAEIDLTESNSST